MDPLLKSTVFRSDVTLHSAPHRDAVGAALRHRGPFLPVGWARDGRRELGQRPKCSKPSTMKILYWQFSFGITDGIALGV